jgi:hypothetical protein
MTILVHASACNAARSVRTNRYRAACKDSAMNETFRPRVMNNRMPYLNDFTARMSSPIEADALTATERSLSVFRSASRLPFRRILLCNDLPMMTPPIPGNIQLQKL